jgi:hypothetical protein
LAIIGISALGAIALECPDVYICPLTGEMVIAVRGVQISFVDSGKFEHACKYVTPRKNLP